MSITISNDNVGFESHSLSGGGLFLYGFNFHNFFSHSFTIFERGDQSVDDLGLFNRHGPSENFFDGGNFTGFD